MNYYKLPKIYSPIKFRAKSNEIDGINFNFYINVTKYYRKSSDTRKKLVYFNQ